MIAAFVTDPTSFSERAISLLGLGVMVGIAWLISTNRRAIRWRPVLWGVGLQLLFAVVVLNPELQRLFFGIVDSGVKKLLSFSEAGASFVFQSVEPHQIVDASGESVTFVGRISPPVKTFAFWILPTIIFFSSLMSILYHMGIPVPFPEAQPWTPSPQFRLALEGAWLADRLVALFGKPTAAPNPWCGALRRR